MFKYSSLFVFCFLFYACNSQVQPNQQQAPDASSMLNNITKFDTTIKTIHVLVALCDNKYQGIVPVPDKIGNGQNQNTNLYWGCGLGIRSYFNNSKEWKLVKVQVRDSLILERLIYKHTSKNYYLVADAYNGKYIKTCTENFLYSCSGQLKDTVHFNNIVIGINGNSKLVSYIGHDGLMDFTLPQTFDNVDNKTRDCVILACISKKYFASYLKPTKAYPLVWTTNLMCPEAYSLHDALSAYINNKPAEDVRSNAAKAYSKYQKCSEKAAKRLLVTGW